MRVIIAGSRSFSGGVRKVAEAVTASGFEVTTVISGAARGADQAGEQWAKMNKVPVERFPADWETYGKGAGHVRNYEMSLVADALISLWDGSSPGTKDMIRTMEAQGKPVFLQLVR